MKSKRYIAKHTSLSDSEQAEINEEQQMRKEVQQAFVQDSGKRGNIGDLAREHGFDPTEFGLE